jgi:DNA polymerase-3 subunit delta'
VNAVSADPSGGAGVVAGRGGPDPGVPPVLLRLAGQAGARAQLGAAVTAPVHAYLLVGPPGSGKREAAVAFGAALLCPRGGCGQCETCRRVLAESHPDLVLVERTGASITVEQAREISRLAARSPAEGARKVLVLTDFHLVGPAAPALLKTIEEPPASAVFAITAERVTDDLVTIASRCVKVAFSPLSEPDIADVLSREGVDAATAADVARSAGGRLDRARLLIGDPTFRQRREAWRSVPDRLDGRGATVMELVAELLEAGEAVLEPVRRRQQEEAAAQAERARATGERGGAKEQEERFRREQRRARLDELRAGLSALAETYRDRLVDDPDPVRAQAAAEAARLVEKAGQALVRNPNESLLLQSLFFQLSR